MQLPLLGINKQNREGCKCNVINQISQSTLIEDSEKKNRRGKYDRQRREEEI